MSVFPFEILPEDKFGRYGDNVRDYINQIVDLLRNPCLGQRLRNSSHAPDTEWRWDHFCKLNLPRQLRLIYTWDDESESITVVRIGPHFGSGEVDDVYDGLATMFRLHPDDRHTEAPTEPCCGATSASGRSFA